MTVVHVHRPDYVMARTVEHCRACHARTRHVWRLFLWYNPIRTCCRCGFKSSGGNRSKPRRRAVAETARQNWATAVRWDEAVARLADMAEAEDEVLATWETGTDA